MTGSDTREGLCLAETWPDRTGTIRLCKLRRGHPGEIHRFCHPDRLPEQPDQDVPSEYSIEGDRYEG